MTATEVTRLNGHHDTFPPDRAGHNDNHGPENYNTSYDRRISKADSPDNLRISIGNLNVDKANVISTSTTFTAATTTTTTGKPEYPPLRTEYGDQWEWDAKLSDYVRYDEKGRHLYTNYQKPEVETAQTKPSPTSPAKQAAPKPPVAWQGVLDDRFQVVSKPKRFFSVGRIFKVAWFEPRGSDTPVRRSNSGPDWASDCPAFYGEKPVAKFRWFVIVRRRLHHSLCFSITTYSKNAANKTTRGRDLDYVVLHSSSVEPARPHPEENITRDPIAVIIEDGETFISPIARLDLGRIYTVEDNLKIMKVGRVHPSSLDDLEKYYKDSVL